MKQSILLEDDHSDSEPLIEEDYIEMKKILINDQFLYLYFNHLGVNECLQIERISDFFEMEKKKKNTHFHFAIVKTKKEINYEDKENQKNIIENHTRELINQNKFILFFPDEEEVEEDESLKFLSLVYSGLINLFLSEEDKTKLKINKINTFNKFIEELKSEILNQEDSELYDFDSNDYFLKTNSNLANEHNKFIETLCENRLENVFKEDKNSEFSYSLFFIKKGILYEFQAFEKSLKIISKSVNNSTVREILFEHIMAQNDAKITNYINDVTIFNELMEEKIENNEVINTKSEGVLLIFLVSFIFIINFLIINPGTIFYDLKMSFYELFELDKERNLLIEGKISTVNELKEYFNKNIMDSIYSQSNGLKYDILEEISQFQDTTTNLYDYNQINPNNTKYYLLSTNFYGGMMINYKVMKNQNKTDFHNISIPIRDSVMGYYESTAAEGLNLLDPDEKPQEDNPLYPQTYQLYFKPTMNMNQKEWLRDEVNMIFNKNLNSFSYTIFVYNSNYQIALIYSGQFQINSFGDVKYSRVVQGFLPFLMQQPGQSMTLIILNIFYMIGFCYMTFIMTRTLSNGIIELVKNSNYTLEWYDYLDISILCVCFVSQLLSLDLILFRKAVYPISLMSEEDFFYWINIMLKMKFYLRITGFAIFLIMIGFIRYLIKSFPHFGIVFDTLKMASKEIMAFIIMVGFMLVINTIAAHISFGWYSQVFKDFESSAITIFLMFLGIFNYSDLVNNMDDNPIAPYFFIFFMCFFSLIIIQVFLCIIRNNYSVIKEKTHIFNEAFSMILQDKSQNFNKKLYYFLICRDPLEIEEEERQGKKINSIQEMTNIQNNKSDDEEEETKKKNNNEVSLWRRFIYNLDRLDLKSVFYGGKDLDKEEFEKEKKEKYKQIYRNNVLESINEIELDYEEEFNQLLQFFLYIIYLIIFVSVIFVQIRFTQSSLIEKYIRMQYSNILVGENANLEDFTEVENNLNTFMKKVYNFQDNCTNYTDYEPQALPFYTNLQPPYFRLTFRFFTYIKNTLPFENEFFPASMEDPTPLDSYYCNSNSEEKIDFILEGTDEDYLGVLRMKYSSPSTFKTPDSCGGYVYLFNRTCPYCISDAENNFTLVNHYYFKKNVGSVTFDTILFPIFHDFIIYVKNSFVKQTLGSVDSNLSIFSIPINKYMKHRDFYRLLLEISFVILTIYYASLEAYVIYLQLKLLFIKDFEDDPDKENFTKSYLFNKFFRLDMNKHINDTFFTFMSHIFYLFFKKLFIFLSYLITALLRYLNQDFFNIVDIFSLSISFMLIFNWIDILNYTGLIDLKFIDEDENNQTNFNLQVASILTLKYKNYIFWLSLNSFIIIVRFLQYFRFSKSINSLISVISRSKSAIFFHFIFVAIINIGFAFMGYALFGHNIEFYSSLSKSILSLIIILSGKVPYQEMKTADSGWAAIFIIIFSVFNFLILFNVLAAIVVEAFREVKRRQSQNAIQNEKVNFIANVGKIIKIKYEIFMKRCELYLFNISKLNQEVNTLYREKYLKTLNEEKKSYIEKETKSIFNFCSQLLSSKELLITYLKDVCNKINHCEKFTSEADLYLIENENIEENELNELYEKFNNVRKTTDITIFTKIMIFISSLINKNIFSLHNEKNEDATKKKKNLRQTLLKKNKTIEKEINLDGNSNVFKKIIKNRLGFIMLGQNKVNLNELVWINEMKKKLTESFQNNEFSFFKENILEKTESIRLSKALKNDIVLKSYTQIYEINEIDADSIYNLYFFVPCKSYPNCQNNKNFECECNQLKKFYDSIQVLIYDTLIKYFYVPYDSHNEDKEMILMHYLVKIKKMYSNTSEFYNKDFSKLICKEKVNLFENDIMLIKNLNIKDNLDILEIQEDNSNISLEKDSLESLYKFFTIWNTLYLIFFKKHVDYIFKLKEKSMSHKILQEYDKNNRENLYDNSYQALIYKFNKFHKQVEESDIKMFNKNNIKKYSNYSFFLKDMISQLKLSEDFDFDYDRNNTLMLFYEDHEKYLIRNTKKNFFCDLLPKEEDISTFSENDYYPSILEKLWHSLNQTEKFFIFYGFNRYIHEGELKIENFSKNDNIILDDHIIETFTLFTQIHQAELIKILKFPKFFDLILIENLTNFVDKSPIEDNIKIAELKKGKEVLNFFHQRKINYVQYYEFMIKIFDKSFLNLKKIVEKTNQEFKINFINFVKANNTFFNIQEHKLEFVKFYKLFLCRIKFDRIISYLDKINEENKSDSDSEEGNKVIINEDEKISKEEKYFTEFENFIFVFSLGPLEFLNMISCMDDEILKEFYMFLFIYLYYDDSDYSLFLNYMEKKVTVAFIEKIKKYTEFLSKREEILKFEETFEKEDKTNQTTLTYMREIKSKIEKLEQIKHSLYEKINMKMNQMNN